ncbi:hypothetical protein X566_08385 [Afipia sp. P52-10]|uniref:hypothetical protein n=1 Tax=Afipia sp. P52-10 TaxID=1429916 RepID=UPI0003DF127D|nr:hypothetical protein [Afipia sp. P52-10]ETR79027.1 hypothetical protein X566_08385 [Afipia sp. P52-10]
MSAAMPFRPRRIAALARVGPAAVLAFVVGLAMTGAIQPLIAPPLIAEPLVAQPLVAQSLVAEPLILRERIAVAEAHAMPAIPISSRFA